MIKRSSTFVITSLSEVAEQTYALRFFAPELAHEILPGQFLNILVSEWKDPLLRRPYRIANVYGDECEILFAVVGKGTQILSEKNPGDTIGVLGPLGNTFGFTKPFSTALLLAGGIGVAPFPFLAKELTQRNLTAFTFLGARSANRLVRAGLPNLHVATDDASEGFHGNVVDCVAVFLSKNIVENPMIFACGPNIMLHAVQHFAAEHGIQCELSLESEMACGIGICQGCPVERTNGERKYGLVCINGPCFDYKEILFRAGDEE